MAVVEMSLPSGSVRPGTDLDVLEASARAVARVSWADRATGSLRDDVLQLTRVSRLVDSARVAALGAFDASGVYRADVHPSASTWLAAKAKADRRRVNHQVGVARTMRSMPLVEDAFRDGSIGFEHVATLARAWAPAFADEFAEAEAELVAAAQTLDFDVFCRAVRTWRDYIDPDGAEARARKQLERREAHASRTLDGMVRVDAWLDAIGGTEFLAEIHRIEQQMFEADWAAARAEFGDGATRSHLGRSAAQRRADALVEMARRSATCENPAKPPQWVLNVMMGYATFCAEARAAAADHDPDCTCADRPPAGGDHQDHDVDPDDDLSDLEDLLDTPRTETTDRPVPSGSTPTSPDADAAVPADARGAIDASDTADAAPVEGDNDVMAPPRQPLRLPDWWRAVDPLPNAGLADTAYYDTMCELEDFTPIAPSVALSLGLAGTIRRTVFGPDSHIIDFGHAVPYLPDPGKEAVRIRDRECRDPGCSIPGRHCEIDHLIPRSRGGPTSVRNCRCECRTGNRVKGTRMPSRD